ncbi:MAG: FeoA family protein [Clostridia bacterium]|nr:FeoA family protein [Clostridia bacterium]
MKLSELKPGEFGKVLSVNCERVLKRRLEHLGLTKGVKISLVRVSPFNDPIEISIRGFYLALRVETAENIIIEKL